MAAGNSFVPLIFIIQAFSLWAGLMGCIGASGGSN